MEEPYGDPRAIEQAEHRLQDAREIKSAAKKRLREAEEIFQWASAAEGRAHTALVLAKYPNKIPKGRTT